MENLEASRKGISEGSDESNIIPIRAIGAAIKEGISCATMAWDESVSHSNDSSEGHNYSH